MRLLRTTILGTVLGLPLALTGCAVSNPPADPEAGLAPERQVVIISIDGLNPDAITKLGPDGTPAIHRMMRQGASTLNARTAVEKTETLPNHTGMVTGRRIDAARGGHGVTWNDERMNPRTVQDAAGHGVDSIFSMAHRNGLDAALYAAKDKFTLFDRSWPDGVDKEVISKRNAANVRTAREDIAAGTYPLTFLHISLPDAVGHDHGWMTADYLRSVKRSDRLVGTVLETIDASPALAERTTVILTADHGGVPDDTRHVVANHVANYRIPFMLWGAEVARGADLYELSPRLADPKNRRVRYAKERQPVRNIDVANAAASLLGIPAVRGSQMNADGELRWQ